MGNVISVWVGDTDPLVADFDEALGQRPDYSRSESVKDAMRLYLTVADTLDTIDYSFSNERAKRAFVKQAMLTQARIERERDE